MQQRDRNRVRKLVLLRKPIYSPNGLRRLMHAATARYLAYIVTIHDPTESHAPNGHYGFGSCHVYCSVDQPSL